MLDLITVILEEQKIIYERVITSIKRETAFAAFPNKIEVALGMRRAGKTFFLLQQMQKLLENESVPWQRCLYVNFEDDRLLPCSQSKFREILESFYKVYPENHEQICYFFLDEVQNIEDWSLVLRRFFDTKKIKIYISGSSAKLLSKEIATELRGRSFPTEVWPFSFSEYLHAKQVNFDTKLFGQKTKDLFSQQLLNYINEGGFPEVVLVNGLEKKVQLLQEYVELVVMRDIIERYNIKNIQTIKYIIKTLLKNAGCSFSVNKLFNDFKSQNIPVTRGLLYDYLGYMEDAYLIFNISLYDESIRKVNSNPKKSYAIDTGLIKAFTFSLNNNYAHLFENLVYLDLKRQKNKIYYYLTEKKYEVDFLVENLKGERKLFQVVWDITDKLTLERETRALKAAEQELNIKGELITPEIYIKNYWDTLC